MKKWKQTGDALAEAVAASRHLMIPRIDDLRPAWFTLNEYAKATGLARNKAERALAKPPFERTPCMVNGRRAYAYRVRK